MIKAQVQPTATGAILFDAALMQEADEKWFQQPIEALAAPAESGGRGSVYYVDAPFGACVLRHYRRGGLVSRFNKERYLWSGRNRTRAFREFHLLAKLHDAGLPVPSPLMARYTRKGLVYQGDLITQRIPGSRTIAMRLAAGELDAALAVRVGRTLAAFHAHGVWHADLNAHNLLVDTGGKVWLIDFDRCRIRKPAMPWQQSNLDRLQRSLRKLKAAKILPEFESVFWHPMLAAYHRSLADRYAPRRQCMNLVLRFLGVGNANAVELGSASAVIERDGLPLMMIDCGPDALTAYLGRYKKAPTAIYLTHAHMDHVGGLERLFFSTYFDHDMRGRLRLYAHAALIPILQGRVADYPQVLAEGGANFWDAFQLVPCSRGFWHDGVWFDIFPTRHHAPMTSFGLSLRGAVVWTGDTRPIPEVLACHAGSGELVAHDCVLQGNPSHSGIDDIEREYPAELRERLILYHYGSKNEARQLRDRGYRVAEQGDGIALAPAHESVILQSAVPG